MNLGIEIGGTKLQLVLGENGKIKDRRRLSVEPRLGASGIRDQIQRTISEFGEVIAAVGVGFGGPVDWTTGRICRSHQIEGWSEFDLGGWLSKLTHRRVRVDNDANVAALGEALYGAGAGLNPVFYITLGSGVGGGLVCNDAIYHGATPGEAEIGHVRLDRQGTIVESRCSGWAVDARIRDLNAHEANSVLAHLTKGTKGGEAKHLDEAIKQGDRGARQILSETAEDLAFGLSHVVHLFHPQIIIIGGGLAGVGERLRVAVEKHLAVFVMDAFAPGPRLALAALGEDAVPIGALELAKAA